MSHQKKTTLSAKRNAQSGDMKYSPPEIEKKWQERWESEGTYQPDLATAKKPYYNLHMFPYPSAEGLHVGNVYAFTGADIHGRFKRMQGYDVFQPFGLDGFGIHSENYALKIGSHPMDQAATSEKRFYKQVESLGSGYDWSRTLETYDPDYYRWTQWIFVELFKAGLAYRAKVEVNWCPSCKTVLADEQVIQIAKRKSQIAKSEDGMSLRGMSEASDEAISIGVCERCGTEVEKRELEQWMFRITEYAEQLLKGLERIDWTEKVKIAQRNWIGKSEGALIKFSIFPATAGSRQGVDNFQFSNRDQKVLDSSRDSLEQYSSSKVEKSIEVFTTRPDTLYGATFLVVSPEHPFVTSFLQRAESREQRAKIEEYREAAVSKTDQDRVAEGREKTGVFSGAYAINPMSNQQIPIWIADYVLMSYGTGAIMAVPAHDQRDFEFAKKYELPIIQVVAPELGPKQENEERRDGGCAVVFDPQTQKYAMATHPNGLAYLFSGGVDTDEDLQEGILREVREESGLTDFGHVESILTCFSHYRNRRKNINRSAMATALLVVLNSTKTIVTDRDEHEKDFTLTWMTPQEILSNWEEQGKDGGLDHWKLFLKLAVGRAIELGVDTTSQGPEFVTAAYTGPGVLINSGDWDGLRVPEEKAKVISDLQKTKAGSGYTNYHLRDWLISRQRYWGPPIPMIYCASCANNGKSWFNTLSAKDHKKLFKHFDQTRDQVAGWYPEDNLPVELPHIEDYKPLGTGNSPLGNHPEFYNVTCPECGSQAKRETDVSDTFLDSSWYFYRYLATEFKSLPFPMSEEAAQAVIENSKLETRNSKQNQNTNDKNSKEFRDSDFDIRASSQRLVWLPPTIYTGGAEHSVLHLLYARFLTKVFKDLDFIEGFDEPFPRFYAHGLIIKDGSKMSKSKGNVVVPDEYIQKFGADTLRSYLMFLGPFNMGGDFRDSGIEGMYRFIKRVWTLVSGVKYPKGTSFSRSGAQKAESEGFHPLDATARLAFDESKRARSEMNKTIKGVTEDIEEFRYNTAIAKIMTYYNHLSKQKTVNREQAKVLLQLLAPFAPHMTEELWQRLQLSDLSFQSSDRSQPVIQSVSSGTDKLKTVQPASENRKQKTENWSIHTSPWPEFDSAAIAQGATVIVVQVNGKLRGTISMASDERKAQSEIEELAISQQSIVRHLEGKTIKKVIYVPGKILNFVVA